MRTAGVSKLPMKIKRKKSNEVQIGRVTVGGTHPVAIQTMTKTRSEDVAATLRQVKEIVHSPCDIVRVAVKSRAGAELIPAIKHKFDIPVVADVHFNTALALLSIAKGADKLRINPGNIDRRADLKSIIKAARNKGVAIRIGINSGSVPKQFAALAGPDALVASASHFVELFEKEGFTELVISVKSSSVLDTVESYRRLSKAVRYPLHIGVTEAGPLVPGTVKSAVGLGILLSEGIGDTLRVSLTDSPVREVEVAGDILASLGLKDQQELISCPTCGRCEVDLIKIAKQAEKLISKLDKPLTVAVMGCVVNGPGEASHADIGVACGKHQGVIFKKGKAVKKVKESEILTALTAEITAMADIRGRGSA